MTLKECVNNKFELANSNDSSEVIEWLKKAMKINADDEITDKEAEVICDRHWESTEEDMFDWIHDGNESPSEIHEASWVTELNNVLVLKNGSYYFWYEIYN